VGSSPPSSIGTGRLERALRWVWLLIGLAVLALLLFSGLFLLWERFGGPAPSSGEPASADTTLRADAAGVRYDPPLAVRGSEVRLALVRRVGGYGYPAAGSGTRGGDGALVNVAFIQGDSVRLLLDRPAFIRRLRFPGSVQDSAAATPPLRWIVYEMALDDADHSGGVDDHDRRNFYLSDLGGRGLRPLLPAGMEPGDWSLQPDGSLLLTAIELGGNAQARQRSFRVDGEGRVTPWAAMDSALQRAARIAAPGPHPADNPARH
jgi:hypothetical protein